MSIRHVPSVSFFVVAFVLLGSLAWFSAADMLLQPPNRDIWQHAAALRALIADLGTPSNPFVVSMEGSRHFQPVWVAGAGIAQSLGLSEWHILRGVCYLSMALLALGIFVFAKAFHPSPWMPHMLLLTMLFGWSIQPLNTGYHAFESLIAAAPYPATFMIGFSLILWALVIHSLRQPWYIAVVLPLAAIMFTTHQLGAVIGFILAGSFALCWPSRNMIYRAAVVLALLAGMGLSVLWPYHNPLFLMLGSGDTSWEGGSEFYSPSYLVLVLFPAIVGVIGLKDPRARSLILGLILYLGIFSLGLVGFQIAGRFVMPITLILHIGLAAFLVQTLQDPRVDRQKKLVLGGGAVLALAFLFVTALDRYGAFDLEERALDISVYQAATQLTDDIPDNEHIAAHDSAAWPVVAVGQRVLSIPWPEPAIHDLSARQAALKQLFDPQLTQAQRIAAARVLDIRTLIVDERLIAAPLLALLQEQASKAQSAGTMIRFDLYE